MPAGRPSPRPVVRLANAVGGTLSRLGLGGVDFEPEALLEEAARRTGLDDFGDPSFREPLEVFLRSCEEDAGLHFLGRHHIHDEVIRALVTRLRATEALRSGADLAALRPPLIVCGLPRSGTTFLHRLLAEAEGARALALWELMDPLPGPGPDRRRQEVERRMTRLRLVSPPDANLDAQHYMRADLPDECGHLLKPAFLSSLFWMVPATGWLAWAVEQPGEAAYREYRDLLRLLQDAPPRRYVLKDPFHALRLPALFAAIPGAMVVQTHRRPSECVPSFHKLSLTLHAALSGRDDLPGVVEASTAFLEAIARHSVEDRARVPAGRVLDVAYKDLVADPVGLARRVHEHFGLGWDEALQGRLEAFVAENTQRRHGGNPYDATTFGQSEAGIDARFAAYRARFLPDTVPGS